jgi:hypothetical protein
VIQRAGGIDGRDDDNALRLIDSAHITGETLSALTQVNVGRFGGFWLNTLGECELSHPKHFA